MDNNGPNPALTRLNALVGEWKVEGSHVLMPDVDIPARATFEWFDGERFLIYRSEAGHPDVPNSISIIGCEDDADHCTMHYFDSRGISRVYALTLEAGVWKIWRDVPGFSQRFAGTFEDGGDTITGAWELCEDDENWNLDLELRYTRVT